jgi:8-oxo-dGTP pyrophosphatase MutT (NUDIX family)
MTARSAKLIVLDENNNVLVLRRSNTHPLAPLQPDLPGGIIEPHESFEHGVIRELREETGLVVTTDQLRLMHTSTKVIHQRVMFAVRVTVPEAGIRISWEHDEYRWVPVAELRGFEAPIQRSIDIINETRLVASLR